MNRDAIDCFERLIHTLEYWAALDEKHGPVRGRTADQRALLYAVEELSAIYPEEHAEAERRVEERSRVNRSA